MTEPTRAPTAKQPSGVELLRLLRRLSKAGRSPDLIRLVERWRERDSLPREARLLMARGLLDLLQYDRAWVELRELTDEDEADLEAHLLIALLFAERGWAERARRVVSEVAAVEPDHPRLPSLERQLDTPVVPPPPDLRGLEASGTPVQILQAGESLLRTGSSLRAQGLLERLRPKAGALTGRVEALLWGLRGDFSSGSVSLAELVEGLRESLPAPSILPRVSPAQALDAREWEALELTESGLSVEPETAEVTRSAVAIASAGRAEPAFPSLFRTDDADDLRLDEEDEVTVASVMADQEQMVDPPTAENTDLNLGFDDDMGGDTQILEIIPRTNRDPGREPTGDSLREATSQPLNLRTLGGASGQREEDSPASQDGLFEDEDADLVVMTRRAPVEEPVAVPRADRRPIEVVEKVPEPPPLPENLPGEDEDTPSLTPLVASGQGPAVSPPSGSPHAVHGDGHRTSILLGLGLGIVLLALVLLVSGLGFG